MPIVKNEFGGGAAPLLDDYSAIGDGGLDATAMVFCHECGAEGPHAEAYLEVRADYFALEAQAVRLWQNRDARHRCLFDAGAAEGLNLYPRENADG